MRSRIVRYALLPVVVVVAVFALSRSAPAPTAVEYAVIGPALTGGQAAQLVFHNTSDRPVQVMLTLRNLEGEVVNKPSPVDVGPLSGVILPYIEQDNVVLHGVHTLGILTISGNMRGRLLAALHVTDEGGMTTILQIGLTRL